MKKLYRFLQFILIVLALFTGFNATLTASELSFRLMSIMFAIFFALLAGQVQVAANNAKDD